jgi:hypothetical protein
MAGHVHAALSLTWNFLPKGKTLKRLFEGFPCLRDSVAMVVLQRYQIDLDDLPQPEDEVACARFEAKLCRDFIVHKSSEDAAVEVDRQDGDDGAGVGSDDEEEADANLDTEEEAIDGLAGELRGAVGTENHELVRPICALDVDVVTSRVHDTGQDRSGYAVDHDTTR